MLCMMLCYVCIVIYMTAGCVVEKADIGFILDSSGSVSASDWTKVRLI